MPFIDTSVFIRYLTRDDPRKADACFALFQEAKGDAITLWTTESVIAEVVYVLSSSQLYHLSRSRIRDLLYPLLSLPGLKLAHRRTYLRALDIYAGYPLDFEDALMAAQMERQGVTELYSYDREYDQVAGLTRIEPDV